MAAVTYVALAILAWFVWRRSLLACAARWCWGLTASAELPLAVFVVVAVAVGSHYLRGLSGKAAAGAGAKERHFAESKARRGSTASVTRDSSSVGSVGGGSGGIGDGASDGAASLPHEPLEPEPLADPALKARMVATVAALELGWAELPPLLDDGAMRVWHRAEGGSVHSFKYSVVMPLAPGACVALAKELDLMPTWHKFVSRGAILGPRPGVFGGIVAFAEVWMPWPLKHRGIVAASAFYDALDDPTLRAYVVHVFSVDEHGPDIRAARAAVAAAAASLGANGAGVSSTAEDEVAPATDAAACAEGSLDGSAAGSLEGSAAMLAALLKVPAGEEQCPRMRFES
jgi:hypothetical protein